MINNGIYYNENPNGDWYDYREIDKTGANYRIIIGMKSNGKTYGMKLKFLENWFVNGKQFAYLRTSVEEIKMKRVSGYWDDMYPVLKEYCDYYFPGYDYYSVEARNGRFILYGGNTDESKTTQLGTMGFYFALNQTKYDSSIPYPNINIICYEEFLNPAYGTGDLFRDFTKFISTIKRKRTDMTVYLLGNTVNRNNAIMLGMGINIRDLTQGKVHLFRYNWGDGNHANTVAVEWCRAYEQSAESESFYHFGTAAELMIYNGQWETGEYCKFNPDKYRDNFAPKLSLVFDCSGIHLYLYLIDDHTMLCSDQRLITYTDYIMINDKPTSPRRRTFCVSSHEKVVDRLRLLIRQFRDNDLILYTSNLVGEDMRHILEIF